MTTYKKLVVLTPGLIAIYLLLGTGLAYLLGFIYSQFQIDLADFPLPLAILFTLILIPTDLAAEALGSILSIQGNLFIIVWLSLLIIVMLLSLINYRKLKTK